MPSGIGPVNWLLFKISHSKFVKFEIPAGEIQKEVWEPKLECLGKDELIDRFYECAERYKGLSERNEWTDETLSAIARILIEKGWLTREEITRAITPEKETYVYEKE